jgi:hypothetical protein
MTGSTIRRLSVRNRPLSGKEKGTKNAGQVDFVAGNRAGVFCYANVATVSSLSEDADARFIPSEL